MCVCLRVCMCVWACVYNIVRYGTVVRAESCGLGVSETLSLLQEKESFRTGPSCDARRGYARLSRDYGMHLLSCNLAGSSLRSSLSDTRAQDIRQGPSSWAASMARNPPPARATAAMAALHPAGAQPMLQGIASLALPLPTPAAPCATAGQISLLVLTPRRQGNTGCVHNGSDGGAASRRRAPDHSTDLYIKGCLPPAQQHLDKTKTKSGSPAHATSRWSYRWVVLLIVNVHSKIRYNTSNRKIDKRRPLGSVIERADATSFKVGPLSFRGGLLPLAQHGG